MTLAFQSPSLARAEFVEWFVACALLVVGTSLLARPRAWVIAFQSAVGHPMTPVLSGLYALLAGLFVVLSHNIWVSDARVLVTILGWFALGASFVLLLVPEAYAALVRRIPLTPQLVALRGLIRIALGGVVLGYLLS
jgi:hypothetical protein